MRRWIVNRLLASPLIPNRARSRLLSAAGIDCRNALIFDSVVFYGTNVHIGAGSFVNCGVYFDHGAPITIGSNVSIAMRATVLTSTHEMGDATSRAPAGSWRTFPVTIGDGAWIGAEARILPGVTIGREPSWVRGQSSRKTSPTTPWSLATRRESRACWTSD